MPGSKGSRSRNDSKIMCKYRRRNSELHQGSLSSTEVLSFAALYSSVARSEYRRETDRKNLRRHLPPNFTPALTFQRILSVPEPLRTSGEERDQRQEGITIQEFGNTMTELIKNTFLFVCHRSMLRPGGISPSISLKTKHAASVLAWLKEALKRVTSWLCTSQTS